MSLGRGARGECHDGLLQTEEPAVAAIAGRGPLGGEDLADRVLLGPKRLDRAPHVGLVAGEEPVVLDSTGKAPQSISHLGGLAVEGHDAALQCGPERRAQAPVPVVLRSGLGHLG